MDNDTELKILQAAEDEFLKKGFSGARTTVIAEKAGVTHAMLHYYFRTKEKLFDKIITSKLALIKEIALSSFTIEEESVERVVRNLITNHLEILCNNPDLPRFLLNELYSDTPRSEILKEKIRMIAPVIISRFQTLLDAAVSKGECRDVDARTIILDIISLNLFPFMASPLVLQIFDGEANPRKKLLEDRREENIKTILSKLRPYE